MSDHVGDANKMVSDTPRTDQMEQHAYWFDDDMTPVCESRFVRPLERELNAANQIGKKYEDRYFDSLERIKQLEGERSWRSIETAPHDYTWVLGFDANDGETGMIIFERHHGWEDDCECYWTDGMRRWTPTHWMPIPDPPESKEAKP